MTTKLHSGGGDDHGGTSSSDQAVIKGESQTLITQTPAEDHLTIAQLSFSKSSSPSPSPSTPFPSTPSPTSQGNPKKSKRISDKLSRRQNLKLPASKLKFVIHDPAGKGLSGKIETAATKGSSKPGQVRSPTMIRAEQVQSSLEPEFPSFIKLMVKSNVASGFWMGFPVSFCKSFLPKSDTAVVLEDDNGEQFQLKYLAQKTGLSAGWGNFAVGHKLLVGDVLIFHLVECYKFKVYIIRENDSTEVDGALGLLNLESHMKENDADAQVAATTPFNQKKRKRQKSLTLTALQKKKRSSLSRSTPQHGQPGNGENSEIGLGIFRFENIKSFMDFNIVVNGLCIDSELPEDVRLKYYELCCSKQAFLHAYLPQGLYFKLVAGIIGETVGIANSLKACKPTTSRENFAVWDKSLESFELLGMMVGFLRKRLRKLQSLAFESEGALDTKRYVVAKTEQNRNADEIRKFEAKLVELKEASGKFDSVIDTLKQKVERHEAKFQEQVDAPW